MKNNNIEKTEFLKIVYFDEAAAQDYVDVTNGGRLDWSTQENKEKIAKIVAEIEAQAKSGFNILNYIKATFQGKVDASASAELTSAFDKTIKNTLLTDYIQAASKDEHVKKFENSGVYAPENSVTLYKMLSSYLTIVPKEEIPIDMEKLNDACSRWREEENIDFSLYGTPLESTTYKFAKCLQKRFGIIKGVTDKNYITNSYHVHVTEEINAFDKLKFEAQFQNLSPGGAVSYVEVPNMENNIDAVLQVMQFIYDNIMYAELNTKSDYCQVCDYSGQIEIVNDEHGKLIWKCPNCGNTDQDKMNVARRTCGYIGTQFWNQGRTQEIKERVLHL